MGYRKVGFLVRLLHNIEAMHRKRWEWIFRGDSKEADDA